MKDLAPSDLKSILHSKRANLYYLEHCRVLVNSGRVEYVTDRGKESLYWNIRKLQQLSYAELKGFPPYRRLKKYTDVWRSLPNRKFIKSNAIKTSIEII